MRSGTGRRWLWVNQGLITRMEAKIQATLARVWGEKTSGGVTN